MSNFEPEDWLTDLDNDTTNAPLTHPRIPDFAERVTELRTEHQLVASLAELRPRHRTHPNRRRPQLGTKPITRLHPRISRSRNRRNRHARRLGTRASILTRRNPCHRERPRLHRTTRVAAAGRPGSNVLDFRMDLLGELSDCLGGCGLAYILGASKVLILDTVMI